MPKPYKTPKCKATPRTPEELTSDYLAWLREHPDATGYIFSVKGVTKAATKAARCTRLMLEATSQDLIGVEL